MFENLPQLCIQIWYTIARAKKTGEAIDIVAVWAFLSSVVSIFVAVIDVLSSQSLVTAMRAAEKENTHFRGHPYFFEISGKEIEENKRKLVQRPNAIRKVFAEILEIDERCIELTLCLSIATGIQFGFTLYTTDTKKVTRYKRLHTCWNAICQNRSFINSVMNVWGLEFDPDIRHIETIYQISNSYEKQEFERDCNAIMRSDFHKQNPWVFQFDALGKFAVLQVDTIKPELREKVIKSRHVKYGTSSYENISSNISNMSSNLSNIEHVVNESEPTQTAPNVIDLLPRMQLVNSSARSTSVVSDSSPCDTASARASHSEIIPNINNYNVGSIEMVANIANLQTIRTEKDRNDASKVTLEVAEKVGLKLMPLQPLASETISNTNTMNNSNEMGVIVSIQPTAMTTLESNAICSIIHCLS